MGTEYDDMRSKTEEESENSEDKDEKQQEETIVSREENQPFASNSGITPSLEIESELEQGEEEEIDDLNESSITKHRQRATNDLLEWRRYMSFQLYVTGHTIPDIATRLLIGQRSVERDISFMKKHSKQVLRHYFTRTLPESVLTNIARLNLISNEAFKSAEIAKEKGQGKLMVDSLRLAKEVAATLIEITTNNKGLIDSAYDLSDSIDSADKELSRIGNELSPTSTAPRFTTVDGSPTDTTTTTTSSI